MTIIRKNITQAKCEARVTKRTKHYDRKCPGLYVSLSPTSPATFSLRYTDPNTHQRQTIWLGVYHADTFSVDHARVEAMHLKARIGRGEDVAQAQRQSKTLQAKLSGVTVDQVIEERITWMQTPVRKADGEMRPRIESWSNVASHLDRFVSPRLGKRIASAQTRNQRSSKPPYCRGHQGEPDPRLQGVTFSPHTGQTARRALQGRYRVCKFCRWPKRLWR
jgi:hypothetical protein